MAQEPKRNAGLFPSDAFSAALEPGPVDPVAEDRRAVIREAWVAWHATGDRTDLQELGILPAA